jgi:glycosyltransferase involved in cell wall biosynthesis
LEEYGAFLYTSLWDGIPNVLLEAAGADLPIVSSNVGGIGELIDVDTGWLIESLQSEDPYVDALREIRDAPPLVESRLTNMRERLKRRHSWKTFIQSMKLAGILERA